MARNPRPPMFHDGMEKRATENLGLEGVCEDLVRSGTIKRWLSARNYHDFFV